MDNGTNHIHSFPNVGTDFKNRKIFSAYNDQGSMNREQK